jgi:hypothetical protein
MAYKTAGLKTDGTSTLAATAKNKSKAKKVWTAVGLGALVLGGLSAWGGFGQGGGSFYQSLGTGAGKLKTTMGGWGSSLFGTGGTPSSVSGMVDGPHNSGLMATGRTAAQAAKPGMLKGFFSGISNMSSGSAHLYGSILETAGNFLSTESEDRLAANAAEHEDLMEYRYDALEAEKAMAEAALAAEIEAAQAAQESRNREGAMASTFMGHTSPIMGNEEGVSGVTPGYTPKPPKTYSEFHPTGGLISAGNVA